MPIGADRHGRHKSKNHQPLFQLCLSFRSDRPEKK
jgi:hypothetical protein